jgi:hypothetical protein
MKLKISLFLLHLRCFPLDVPYAYFSGSEPLNLIEFRRNLAKELLDYSYQVCGRRGVHEGLCASTCGEETAPRIAGQWTGTEWTQLATMYPQYVFILQMQNRVLDVPCMYRKTHCIPRTQQ